MFNKGLVAVALFAASAFTNPTPSGKLQKRDVTCHQKTYTSAEVELCRKTLCYYNPYQGPKGYPHPFKNHEQLNFGTYTGDLYEYPLISGNQAFNGGSQGADRCVAAYDSNTGNCDLVGAMTHNGLPAGSRKNAFKLCT